MAVFTGCYYALGTGVSNAGVFTEATTYTRPAVSTTGTALSGLTQAISQITGPTGPVGGSLTKGAIFDSLTGGNCLAYWDWTLLTAVPANFLAITGNIIFNTQVQTAVNLALLGGQGTVGSLIDAGAQIGTFNGQPMIAATRLNVAAGGFLTAHLGSGQWIANADVQNTLSVGGLAATSVYNGITATAGASQTGAALLSGFVNRITTVASATDSCILPGPTLAPVGTILIVINAAAANATNIYPDTGAQINALTATTGAFSVAINKPTIFVRTGTLTWSVLLSA